MIFRKINELNYMNSRERVLGAFNRTGYDRIPVKHEGTPEINQMIMDHYG